MASEAARIGEFDRRLREEFRLPPRRLRMVKFKYRSTKARNKAAKTLKREGYAVKKLRKRELMFQRLES
jgi:hypothetical protein